MSPPDVVPLFTIDVDLERPITMTPSSGSTAQFIPIVGGRVHGPRLDGRVLPHGGDWALEHDDGSMSIHARYFIESEDGTLIGVDNAGVWREREGDEPYFVTTPLFVVGGGPYSFLEKSVFIGMGREISPTRVCIDVSSVVP